jgi:hypothetical protein
VAKPVKASEVEVEDQTEPGANVGTPSFDERVAFWAEKEPYAYYRAPVSMVTLAKRNPRRGAVADAIESLREFGQHRAAVVQQATGEVVIGNHMLKAMHALGWDELDVFLVDDKDEKALRRGLADNAVGDKAGWDDEELAAALKEVGPVPGLDDSDVEKLMKKLEPPEEPKEAVYPLVPRLNEKYDYLVVFAENETDATWLQTRFDLRREKSYKSNAVATSHVITIARLRELLGED